MYKVNCKVEERDPLSDLIGEKIATTPQTSLDITESTKSRSVF